MLDRRSLCIAPDFSGSRCVERVLDVTVDACEALSEKMRDGAEYVEELDDTTDADRSGMVGGRYASPQTA